MLERRIGLRAQVDLPGIELVDGFPHACRVVDISARGMVLVQPRSLATRTPRIVHRVDVAVRRAERPLHALGRAVWTDGRALALRYIAMSDVDRLEIAELLDRLAQQGGVLH